MCTYTFDDVEIIKTYKILLWFAQFDWMLFGFIFSFLFFSFSKISHVNANWLSTMQFNEFGGIVEYIIWSISTFESEKDFSFFTYEIFIPTQYIQNMRLYINTIGKVP